MVPTFRKCKNEKKSLYHFCQQDNYEILTLESKIDVEMESKN